MLVLGWQPHAPHKSGPAAPVTSLQLSE